MSQSQGSKNKHMAGSLAHSQSQHSFSNNNAEPETDTVSASLNLEDIIENYDGRSKSTSLVSFLNAQLSQSYFSVFGSNNKDDETTSFYSALQDGFSLSEYRTANLLSSNPEGAESFWDGPELSERDNMLPKSNFEVSWSDLTYQIIPKITLASLWFDLEQKCRQRLAGLVSNKRSDRYQFKQTNHQEPITILQQISGSFRSGELTGVLGPSGAGKTSLLNFLSRRREDGYSGHLNIDNSYRRIKISTIPQNDHLPEYLSVRENLMFASRLNNRRPSRDHENNIQRVAELLGLDQCLDVRTKKISGGQHKRLAIAQELLTKPDILILDEPTSGLDSLTCFKTISVLKDLVKSAQKKLIDPIAIVLTIHQPQQDVFDLFDKVYVMANGGIAIYDGPPELCSQYIAQHTGIQMPDLDYNPATFAIEIASGEFGMEPIKALERQVKLEFKEARASMGYKSSGGGEMSTIDHKPPSHEKQLYYSLKRKHNKHDVESLESPNDINNKKPYLHIDERIARGSSLIKGRFFGKTRVLSERYWISILRDPKQMIARILFHIFLPVALASMMGKEPGRAKACPKFQAHYDINELLKANGTMVSDDVQEELLLTLENLSTLFVLVYALTSANIAAITLSFCIDMASSLKEHYNGWYSMTSYLLARILTDIPMSIILPLICLLIGYPLTGQVSELNIEESYRVLITAVAVILGSMVGQTLGMVVGAIYIGHVSTALFVSQGVTLPLVFLSGFVIRTKNMSKLVYLMSFTSFYRHILEVTVVARYGFNVCRCDATQITGKDSDLVGISDELRSFTQNWLNLMSDPENTALSDINATDPSPDKSDLFSMFAKQVSLYNTYGVDVRNCTNVIPFQLHELSVREPQIKTALLALVATLFILEITLFITVKLVVKLRTSL